MKKTDELNIDNHASGTFRPLLFNEAISIFWRHCSLAKKKDAPSSIGVISEYFTNYPLKREQKAHNYDFLDKFGGIFRTLTNFFPVYSTCNDITPYQLFFYLWVEPILNPKLLSKLPKQHPLNQKQFVVLTECYERFKDYNNDTLRFSENIRKEMLSLLNDAENKSFQLKPNKPPTYYGKMSEEIARWRSFYQSDEKNLSIKKNNIERSILLYKSWRIIIEIPSPPKRRIHKVADEKLFHFLLSFLIELPPLEQMTTVVNSLSNSPKVIQAINSYYKNGFKNNPNKEQILIKLITTVPKEKLPSLFEDTPVQNSIVFFWSKLKFMAQYVYHDDPDIWLRSKMLELNGEGATARMYENRNGLFWPWLLTEQLKWDLCKPYDPYRVIFLSTKLLVDFLAKPSSQVKVNYKITHCDDLTFKNYFIIASKAFGVSIPNNSEVRSTIFLLCNGQINLETSLGSFS